LPRIECCSKILRGYQIECQHFGLKRYLWFDLDGTLVDRVYQHILAWREALDEEGIEFLVWQIRRKIGMSGGLFANQLLRETGVEISLVH
jgi:phosphoglycolate phosphatase-like HAD superfamily hydrolase